MQEQERVFPFPNAVNEYTMRSTSYTKMPIKVDRKALKTDNVPAVGQLGKGKTFSVGQVER